MKTNDTSPLGYVDGRAVFVGAELEQLTRKGWVRHNAQESWRDQNIDWKNDFRWPAEGVKPLFKLDRLDSLLHQLINVTSDLHRSVQPDPNYRPTNSIKSLPSCDECAGTGSIGPDSDPTEMACEVCEGTGTAPPPATVSEAKAAPGEYMSKDYIKMRAEEWHGTPPATVSNPAGSIGEDAGIPADIIDMAQDVYESEPMALQCLDYIKTVANMRSASNLARPAVGMVADDVSVRDALNSSVTTVLKHHNLLDGVVRADLVEAAILALRAPIGADSKS